MRSSNLDTQYNKKFTSRNSSVGNFKRTLPLQMSSIITQVDENSNPRTSKKALSDDSNERVHSPLPRGKHLENFLLPEQQPDKVGKKTLILDLDETLVHSGFEPFKTKADIEIKVKIIF
jgi:RNA polymerase II subunit A small phosphatase-like protein